MCQQKNIVCYSKILAIFTMLTLFFIQAEVAFATEYEVIQKLPKDINSQLIKAQKLIGKKQHKKAKIILDQLNDLPNKNNYTRAQIANFTGYYFYDLDDYKSATDKYLEVIIDPSGIPTKFYNQTFYIVSQLYFQREDYHSALEYGQKWFNVLLEPSAEGYAYLAQIHYKLESYDKVLSPLERAIEMYEGDGKKPKKSWLLIQRSINKKNADK